MKKKSVSEEVPFCPLTYPTALLGVHWLIAFLGCTALKVFENIAEYHILSVFISDVLQPLFRCRNTQFHGVQKAFVFGGRLCIGYATKCVRNHICHARIIFHLIIMLLQLVEVSPLTARQLILLQYML